MFPPARWFPLLPLDPDASARRLRAEIEREAKARVAVIITRYLRAAVAAGVDERRHRSRRAAGAQRLP